jgi:hypothetical protein
VWEMANIILQEDILTPSQPIRKNWVTQFISRYDEI